MSDFTYSWDFETWPSNEKGTIRSRWSTNSILFRIQMNNWEHSNESATLSEKIIIILFTHSMHRFDDIKEYFIVRIKISTKLFYYWQLVTGVWCTGHGREKNTIIQSVQCIHVIEMNENKSFIHSLNCQICNFSTRSWMYHETSPPPVVK